MDVGAFVFGSEESDPAAVTLYDDLGIAAASWMAKTVSYWYWT